MTGSYAMRPQNRIGSYAMRLQNMTGSYAMRLQNSRMIPYGMFECG